MEDFSLVIPTKDRKPNNSVCLKNKAWIGIDPGISKTSPGAAALIHEIGYEYFDWTNEKDGAEKCRRGVSKYHIVLVPIERQWARPNDSKQNVSKIMQNFGTWIGMCIAHGVEYFEPTPKKWQAQLVFKRRGEKIQSAYLSSARKHFPEADLRFQKHNGRAAALLIAYYCKSVGYIRDFNATDRR